MQAHRYLVVSRERFLVLDASGGGVGSEAVVKSNRHLTEVSGFAKTKHKHDIQHSKHTTQHPPHTTYKYSPAGRSGQTK